MNSSDKNTPDMLAATGRALYGDRWQTALANDLNVAERTIRRWLTGELQIPGAIESELRALLIERVREIGGMIGYSVNPADRTVFHYPTAACFRYDDADDLTLLNPQMVELGRTALIQQGAAEALRQERERDPLIKLVWADPNGGENSSKDVHIE